MTQKNKYGKWDPQCWDPMTAIADRPSLRAFWDILRLKGILGIPTEKEPYAYMVLPLIFYTFPPGTCLYPNKDKRHHRRNQFSVHLNLFLLQATYLIKYPRRPSHLLWSLHAPGQMVKNRTQSSLCTVSGSASVGSTNHG